MIEITEGTLVVQRLERWGETMTEGELEMVRLICLPRKIACQRLGISANALGCRITRLIDKCGVENQRALVVKAVKTGLLLVESFEYRDFNGQK